MCGLAGILRFDDERTDPTRLRALLDHLRHRGPDGRGLSTHGRCTLVHTRLAVLDPIGGRQPMCLPRDNGNGALQVVFNGEIYNHRSLRWRLEKAGHRFASDHSDTEVLLLGYRQWGERLPEYLDGMFAFAIWDQDRGQLFLARDRTGKKPLYFSTAEPHQFIFASTVSALVASLSNGPPSPAPHALLSYLRRGYPLGCGMFVGIEELSPAHWMSINQAEGVRRWHCYWQPPPLVPGARVRAAKQAVRTAITHAVRQRMEADVPLGCFLSGGIDSSLIAALAQQHQRERGGEALRTFSVAMPDMAFDESAYAATVARHLGTNHTVLRAEPSDVIEDLRRLMAVTGEPTADSSLIPTFRLCRAAREHVSVALSGDGGDELFAGYDRYRALRLLETHRAWLRFLPPSWLHDAQPRSWRTRLRRLVEAARAGAEPARQYHQMMHLFTDAQIRALGPPSVAVHTEPNSPAAPDWPEVVDVRRAAMLWDQAHYLPHELLRKLDRASMAVALEVRCPLLDTQVRELAQQLPVEVLMAGGRAKGLLRAIAAEYLPRQIVHRPKRGFAVPIGRWFREQLKDPLADHLFDGSLESMGLNRQAIRQLFDEHIEGRADHTHRLFALLQLSLWRQWMREPTPAAEPTEIELHQAPQRPF